MLGAYFLQNIHKQYEELSQLESKLRVSQLLCESTAKFSDFLHKIAIEANLEILPNESSGVI